ncbi:venom acid phosphatase Acph-1-like [Tenebrio molitor]|uniref:venom acid phosphatase Acph-1-like n=1 Tax=Tenebrio molitor TaxID=7067 RepID=UPI0036246A45
MILDIFQIKLNGTDLTKPSILYGILSRQEEWHLKLPNWTDVVYPETLYKMASKNYLILSGTTELKQIGAGYLLQKIVHDTQLKVNASDKVSEERKMYLYSGHEMNIALLLNTLEIFQPHYPPYCSCILIEVHRINNQLGIKIFYENDESIQTGLLKMPNCEEFCPLDKFISFVEKYFPNENSCS